MSMTRYQNLFNALNELGETKTHLRLLEVGTYDGVRACQLLGFWLNGNTKRSATYVGFDLFEAMTQELTAAELSKTRLPPSRREVLKRISGAVPKASVTLRQGNTRQSIPAYVSEHKEPFDLIFIDGGHSLETIASDWNAVKELMNYDTIVLFDDYYENRDDFGCRPQLDLIRDEPRHDTALGEAPFVPKYSVTLLDPVDKYDHTKLEVRMARVQLVKP